MEEGKEIRVRKEERREKEENRETKAWEKKYLKIEMTERYTKNYKRREKEIKKMNGLQKKKKILRKDYVIDIYWD